MKPTRATNYAVRALVALARRGRAEVASLARELGTPRAFLAKVLRKLSRAGLVSGERGARGGYSLARESHGISLRDVLQAIEGGASLARCLGPVWGTRGSTQRPERRCPLLRRCPARPAWQRIAARLNSALESETIGALAASGNGGGQPGGGTCGTTRRR